MKTIIQLISRNIATVAATIFTILILMVFIIIISIAYGVLATPVT